MSSREKLVAGSKQETKTVAVCLPYACLEFFPCSQLFDRSFLVPLKIVGSGLPLLFLADPWLRLRDQHVSV